LGAAELQACLEDNETLTVLHLAGNNIGPVRKRAVGHQIQRNKRKQAPKPDTTYVHCHITPEDLCEQRYNEKDPVLLTAMTALNFLVREEGRYYS
jgi:hypothetical protein